MPHPDIARRYQAICQRSFERHLDLFLTTCLLRGSAPALATYQIFQPTPQEWAWYVQSQQAKTYNTVLHHTSVGELDKAINAWWSDNTSSVAAYKARHLEVHCISAADFEALFTVAAELACAYCRITHAQFQTLINAGQVQTKRLRTRGTSLEIDCRIPRLGYTKGNVVLCCYWCNNAKTDEFTEMEFQPVAEALALVWRQRLAQLAA